jgi:hypothetical protein
LICILSTAFAWRASIQITGRPSWSAQSLCLLAGAVSLPQ